MHHDFWYEKWNTGNISFHQLEVDKSLIKYCDKLNLAPNDIIFVPLCGKNLDMLWLRAQGYKVVGVELSERACEDFFIENDIQFEVRLMDKFRCFMSEKIVIYQGDYFHLTPNLLIGAKAVYDRRALVALPDDMRIEYTKHLLNIMPASFKQLLLSLEYKPTELKAPPFNIDEREIQKLYGGHFDIERLEMLDVKDRDTHLVSRALQKTGLSYLREGIYLMQK